MYFRVNEVLQLYLPILVYFIYYYCMCEVYCGIMLFYFKDKGHYLEDNSVHRGEKTDGDRWNKEIISGL